MVRTKTIWLRFDRLEKVVYNVYTDASFRKNGAVTTIGTAHMINGSVFDWSCFKSKKVYSSINEAEFAAIFDASRSVVYFNELMEFIKIKIELPVEIENDNQGAVDLVIKSVGPNTRDASAEHLKVINWNQANLIRVSKIETDKNPADLLTKPLEYKLFREHIYTLGYEMYDESIRSTVSN